METITYSLQKGNKGSDQYYQSISRFTDQVLEECGKRIGFLVEDYMGYLRKKRGAILTKEEYVVEVLVLGVLWSVYARRAAYLGKLPGHTLKRLAGMRRRYTKIKRGIDWVRGVLLTLFLQWHMPKDEGVIQADMQSLEKLIDWLVASGEFAQEVNRLTGWREFLHSRPLKKANQYIQSIIDFAGWFEMQSVKCLGKYTSQVEPFLKEQHPQHRWREDVIFCGRQRVEYHLNMVGAEIMNRAFRDDFLKAPKKVVFVPACMRCHGGKACKAYTDSDGTKCAGCSQDCRVNQLTRLGGQYGFGVAIIFHQSSFFSAGASEAKLERNIGAVGVACVLNLIGGGWMLQDMGVPAQCVLLDYCGCKNHWHDQGVVTGINLDELGRILQVELGKTEEKAKT